ncbi:hypothetical protein OU995_08400 [Roseateles sp. SL47]|uniref:hypothetical protein n=1 Tax=Roseateles sp. SL47 TaxID=2995138 RepID=UPI00226FCB8F|nr:hypothetical protein [Roseateles sp. SL47]WAC74706.1 hypothetical protein OU995_08400 [Roseateles sp. SL47]
MRPLVATHQRLRRAGGLVLGMTLGLAALGTWAGPRPQHPVDERQAGRPLSASTSASVPASVPVRTAGPWAPDLRERIDPVPVRVVDAQGRMVAGELPVTVFRPAGPGPFPLAVISHGRDWRQRAHYQRQRYESAARFFVRKGYAVAVPLRLGYGELAAAGDPESTLSCDHPRYAEALGAAGQQIASVVRFMVKQPDIEASRTVLVGQSVGGMASLAALAALQSPVHPPSSQPLQTSQAEFDVPMPSILAVINISGGHGGRPDGAGSPCRPDLLKQELARLGRLQHQQPEAAVPTLWLYADNDRFFGAHWPTQWAQAYQEAGGRMSWRSLPPVGQDGHRLFTEANDVWQPVVDAFLRPLGVEIPGALPYPPEDDRGWVDVGDLSALPTSTPELQRLYRAFLAAPLPRAFAMNGQTRSAFATGDDASSRALARCEEGAQAETPCHLYAVNRTVVWSPPRP